jgi:hypothetical protein
MIRKEGVGVTSPIQPRPPVGHREGVREGGLAATQEQTRASEIFFFFFFCKNPSRRKGGMEEFLFLQFGRLAKVGRLAATALRDIEIGGELKTVTHRFANDPRFRKHAYSIALSTFRAFFAFLDQTRRSHIYDQHAWRHDLLTIAFGRLVLAETVNRIADVAAHDM